MDELDKLYQQYSNNGGQDTFEVFSDKVLFEPNFLEDLKKKDQTAPEVPSNSQPQTTALPISNDLELNPAQQEAISQAQRANSLVSGTTENPSLPVSPATETVSSGLGNSDLANTAPLQQPDLSLPSQVAPVAPEVNISNFNTRPPAKDPKKLLGVDTNIDNPIATQPQQQDIFQLQESEKLDTTDYQKPKDVKLEVITSGAFEGNNILGNTISKADELSQYQDWQSKEWGSILPDEKNGRPQFQVNDAGQKPIKELLGMRTPDAYDYQAATDKAMKPILQQAEIENQLRKEQESVLGPDYFNEKGLLTRAEFEQAKQQKLTQDYINQGYTNEQAVAMTNQYLQNQTEEKNALASQYINGIMQRAQYVNDLFDGKAEQNSAFTATEKQGWYQVLTEYPQDFADYLKARGYDKFGEVGDYNFELESGKATGRRRILDDFFNWKKQNLIDYSVVLKNRDEQAKMDINKAIERKDATALQQLREQRNNTTIAEINQESALFNKINQDEVNINKNFDVTEKLKMDAAKEYGGYQSGKPQDVLSYSAKTIGTGLFKVAADVVSAPLALISPISKTTRQVNETVNNEISNPLNVLQSGWDDKVKIYQDEKTGKQYEERFGFVYEKDANGNLTLDENLSYNGTKGLKFIKEETDFNIASAAGTIVNMTGTMVAADGLAGFIKGGTSSRLARWAGKSAEALGKENILTKSLYTAAEAAQSYNKASALSWSYVTARQNMETAQEAGLSPLQSLAYTVFQSAATGLMTRVHPDDIFFKEYSATNKNLFRLLSNNKLDEARLLATDFIKKYAKTAAGENVQEFSEQIVQDLVNKGFNFINEKDKSGKEKFTTSDINDYFSIGEQTSAFTFVLNAFNALGRGRIRTNGMTNLEKAIVASQLPEAKQMLYDLSDQSLTGYTFDKANTMLAQINEVEKYTKQIPDGVQLNVSQTADVILKMQQAEQLKSKIKENSDSPANGVIQEQLDGINQEIDKILKEGLQNANKTKIDLNAKTGDQLIQPITNEQNPQSQSQQEAPQGQAGTAETKTPKIETPQINGNIFTDADGKEYTINQYGKDPANAIMITVSDGNKVIASANFTQKKDGSISSEATNVQPEYRRKGIATAMYDYFRGQGFEIQPAPDQLKDGKSFTDSYFGKASAKQYLIKDEETIQQLKDAGVPEEVIQALPANTKITEKFLMGQEGDSLLQKIFKTAFYGGEASTLIARDQNTKKMVYFKTGKIDLNKIYRSFESKDRKNYVLTHEAVHAATVLTLEDIKANPESYTKEQIEAADNLNFYPEYYRDLVKSGDKNKVQGVSRYGLKNGSEFVAEFISNKKFREWILDRGNENFREDDNRNILQKIWDNILKVIGINKNKPTDFDTKFLNQVNSDIITILKKQRETIIKAENETQQKQAEQQPANQPEPTISTPYATSQTSGQETNAPVQNQENEVSPEQDNLDFLNNLVNGQTAQPTNDTTPNAGTEPGTGGIQQTQQQGTTDTQTVPTATYAGAGQANAEVNSTNQFEYNKKSYTQNTDGSFSNENGNKVTNPKTISGLNQLAEARTKGEVVDTKESNGYVWNKYTNGSEEIISPKGSKIEPNGKNKKGKTVTNANFTKNKAKIFGQKTDNEIKVEYEQRTKEALNNFYPTNATEAAKLFFANNGKVSPESISSEVLGNSERLQVRGIKPRKLTDFIWAYLGKGEQPSIANVSERLAQEYPNMDEKDLRNELIDVINSYSGAKEIQEEIVDLYNRSNDPYFGFTDAEIIAQQESEMSQAKRSFYESVQDPTNLMSDEDLFDYYKQGYENSIQSLTNEQQDRLYTATEQRATRPNESNQTQGNERRNQPAESQNTGQDQVKLQSGNQRFTPLTKEAFQNLIDRLQKAFPKFAKVTTSWDEFYKKAKSGGYNVNFDANFSKLSDLRKQKQLALINEKNPAPNNYNTWIRNESDILTAQEAFNEAFSDGEMYPDFTVEDMQTALDSGKITIYSSYPIEEGVFVTPSRMNAESYSGDGNVYSKEVNVNDLAWIDQGEGQYAPVQFMHNANGTVYGAKIPDGTIYINPQYLNANTPIHEFSHLWEQLLPKAWAKGLEIFKQTKTGKDLHSQLKNEGNYDNLTDEQLWSEAMNTHIGNIGEERYQNPKGKMAQFMEWLRNTFAKLGEFLKYGGKLSPETQLKTFTEKVLGDLIGGKPVTVESEIQSNNSPDFQIIGEQGAKNLDAAEEATTRLDNLSIAREMENSGKSEKEIRFATGWEKGADGKWRYEIDDNFNIKRDSSNEDAFADIFDEANKRENGVLLSNIINYPELFSAYPILRRLRLKVDDNISSDGLYSPKENTLVMKDPYSYKGGYDKFNSVLIHEIQHAIQEIEGFAKGGNLNTLGKFDNDTVKQIVQVEKLLTDIINFKEKNQWLTEGKSYADLINDEIKNYPSAYPNNIYQWALRIAEAGQSEINLFLNETPRQQYKRLAGETEARNVQTRANMSMDERRATLLSETEDIAREDQIILMNSLGTANSLPIRKNLIPNSTINTVVDEIRNNGLDAGLRKFQESTWYKNLSPEQKGNITLDNYAAMLLKSAKANQSIKQVKEQNNKPNSEQATTQSRNKAKVTERIKPAVKINVKSVKKLNQIIADAAKSLQTTLIYGKALSRNAAGTYNPTNTLVRIKNAGDLDTVAHELGHFIDDKFNFLGNLQKSNQISIEKEIKWFYERGGSNPPTGLSKEQKQNYLYREGLAEFVRAYIVNPEAAQSVAPSLYSEFESVLDDKALQSIKDFSNDVINFSNASYADKISSNVQESSLKDKESFLKWKKEADGFGFRIWDNINANIFDSMAKANKAFLFINKLKGDPKLLPEKDFKLLHRVFAGVNGKIDKILMNGMVDGKNRPVLSSDGERMNMKWLLGSFDTTSPETVKADMDETIRLLIAERTIEYAKKFRRLDDLSGIGGGLQSDFEVAQGYIDEFEQLKTDNREKYERIKESAARYREFADAGLRYAVEKGRLSEEDYKKIKESNEYYVNMTRVRETVPTEEDEAFFGAGKNITDSIDIIKKSKGGTDMIGNPYESLLINTANIIKESDRNEVMRSFIEPLKNVRQMGDGTPINFSQIARPAGTSDKNVKTVYINGVKERWQFSNDVIDAFSSLDGMSKDGIVAKIAQMPAQLMRFTVTNFPIFAARNVTRDTVSRVVMSRTGSGFKELIHNAKDSELFSLYGGAMAGYYGNGKQAYIKHLNESIKKISKNKKSIVINPTNIAATYGNFLQKSENLNRIAEYKSAYNKAIKEGMDEYNAGLYAAFEARDLMDFAVSGTVIRELNKYIPFLNAGVQGMVRVKKQITEKPITWAVKTAMYTVLPTLFMRALVHALGDDDEYEELPDYQRDLFWNYKLPGSNVWLSIPKPYENGVVSAIVDRAISKAMGNDAAFDGLTGSVLKTLVPIDESSFLGSMKPIVENLTNYDFFRDKSIVNQWDEGKARELRNGDKTASRISQTTTDLLYKAGYDVNPQKLDHLIKGYGTYMGDMALRIGDVGVKDSRFGFGVSQLGFAKESPLSNSKTVKKIYDLAESIGYSQKTSIRRLRKMVESYYEAETVEDQRRITKEVYAEAKSILPRLEERAKMEKEKATRK